VSAEVDGESAKLVRMANQIADYFRAYPDDVAREGVRNHLKSFWTPRMLRELQGQADAPSMHPLVHAVLPLLN